MMNRSPGILLLAFLLFPTVFGLLLVPVPLMAFPGDPLLVEFEKGVNGALDDIRNGRVEGLSRSDIPNLRGKHVGGYANPGKTVNDVDFTVGHRDQAKQKAFADAIRNRLDPQARKKITILEFGQVDGIDGREVIKGKVGQTHTFDLLKSNEASEGIGRATIFSEDGTFEVFDTSRRIPVNQFFDDLGTARPFKVEETHLMAESVAELAKSHSLGKNSAAEKFLTYGKYLNRDMFALESKVSGAYEMAPGGRDLVKGIQMDQKMKDLAESLADMKREFDPYLSLPDRKIKLGELENRLKETLGLGPRDSLDDAFKKFQVEADAYMENARCRLDAFESLQAKMKGKPVDLDEAVTFSNKLEGAARKLNIILKGVALYQIIGTYYEQGEKAAFYALAREVADCCVPGVDAAATAAEIGQFLLLEGVTFLGDKLFFEGFTNKAIKDAFDESSDHYIFSDAAEEFYPDWMKGVSQETIAAAVTGMSFLNKDVWQDKIIDCYVGYLRTHKSSKLLVPLDGVLLDNLRAGLKFRLDACFKISEELMVQVEQFGQNMCMGRRIAFDALPFRVFAGNIQAGPGESASVKAALQPDGSSEILLSEVRSFDGTAKLLLTNEELEKYGYRKMVVKWRELKSFKNLQEWAKAKTFIELDRGYDESVTVTVDPAEAEGWTISAQGIVNPASPIPVQIKKSERFTHEFDNSPTAMGPIPTVGDPLLPGQSKTRTWNVRFRFVPGPGIKGPAKVKVSFAFSGNKSKNPGPSVHTVSISADSGMGFVIQPASARVKSDADLPLRAVPVGGASLPGDLVWTLAGDPIGCVLKSGSNDQATLHAGKKSGTSLVKATSPGLKGYAAVATVTILGEDSPPPPPPPTPPTSAFGPYVRRPPPKNPRLGPHPAVFAAAIQTVDGKKSPKPLPSGTQVHGWTVGEGGVLTKSLGEGPIVAVTRHVPPKSFPMTWKLSQTLSLEASFISLLEPPGEAGTAWQKTLKNKAAAIADKSLFPRWPMFLSAFVNTQLVIEGIGPKTKKPFPIRVYVETPRGKPEKVTISYWGTVKLPPNPADWTSAKAALTVSDLGESVVFPGLAPIVDRLRTAQKQALEERERIAEDFFRSCQPYTGPGGEFGPTQCPLGLFNIPQSVVLSQAELPPACGEAAKDRGKEKALTRRRETGAEFSYETRCFPISTNDSMADDPIHRAFGFFDQEVGTLEKRGKAFEVPMSGADQAVLIDLTQTSARNGDEAFALVLRASNLVGTVRASGPISSDQNRVAGTGRLDAGAVDGLRAGTIDLGNALLAKLGVGNRTFSTPGDSSLKLGVDSIVVERSVVDTVSGSGGMRSETLSAGADGAYSCVADDALFVRVTAILTRGGKPVAGENLQTPAGILPTDPSGKITHEFPQSMVVSDSGGGTGEERTVSFSHSFGGKETKLDVKIRFLPATGGKPPTDAGLPDGAEALVVEPPSCSVFTGESHTWDAEAGIEGFEAKNREEWKGGKRPTEWVWEVLQNNQVILRCPDFNKDYVHHIFDAPGTYVVRVSIRSRETGKILAMGSAGVTAKAAPKKGDPGKYGVVDSTPAGFPSDFAPPR